MLTIHVSGRGRTMGRLDLPMPLEEIRRQMETIRAKCQPNDVLSIRDAACPIPDISWHLQHIRLDSDATLQKLNRLAEAISKMDVAGFYQLNKSLSTDSQQSLNEILRNAAHIKPVSMDCYEVIPEVTTHQALGKWLVEHNRLEEQAPNSLRPYLDYRSIGVDYCGKHDGVFLSNSYAGIRSDTMEQVLIERSPLRLFLTASKKGFTLYLPASDDQLEDAKMALDLEDFSQAAVSSVEFTVPHLQNLIPTDLIKVEEAHALAQCLQDMERNDGELMKYCSALSAENPTTFSEAVSIAMDIDDYEQVPEDMDEYGKQVLRRVGADDEVIDTIDGYMDFARLGEDSLAEDGVRRTEYGLVRRLSKPFPPEQEIGQTMM